MRALKLLAVGIVTLLALPAAAAARGKSYTSCPPVGDASIVQVAGTTCESVTALVTGLLDATPDSAAAVLTAAGWSAVRAREAGATQHDLVAIRGLETLRIRRPGAAPDLDGWAAGRELIFARSELVPGQRAPKGTVFCTSAFLVRLPAGRLGGLSAGHCGGLRKDRTVHRRNAVMRRPPTPGVLLGRVVRMLPRTQPLDALVVGVPEGANRPTTSVVNRGIGRPPWRVVSTASPQRKRKVCMTGRTSGADRCGRILGPEVRRAERALSFLAGGIVRCTSIVAAPGDSGGPVYTSPTTAGRVRAVGIAVIIVRPSHRMCFTPIRPVLRAIHAKLVPAAQ